MMQYNLTEKQLKALRWIVQNVQSNKLGETFTIWYIQRGRPEIKKFSDEVPSYLDDGTITALGVSGVLITKDISRGKIIILTGDAYTIAAFDFANKEPNPIRDYLRSAHKILDWRFKNPELESLCFHMGINPERVFVPGDLDWPRHLLIYLSHRQRLNELQQVINELRPDIEDWPSFPTDGWQ